MSWDLLLVTLCCIANAVIFVLVVHTARGTQWAVARAEAAQARSEAARARAESCAQQAVNIRNASVLVAEAHRQGRGADAT